MVSFLIQEDLEAHHDAQSKEGEEETHATKRVKTMLILFTVGRKLVRNPNFHATLLGLIWASIHFR